MTKSWNELSVGCTFNLAAVDSSVVAIPFLSVLTKAPKAPPPPTLRGSAFALASDLGVDVLWYVSNLKPKALFKPPIPTAAPSLPICPKGPGENAKPMPSPPATPSGE